MLYVLVVIACCLIGQDIYASEVTYSNSIAKIVFDHCATCHRPGQSGPFSLLTYEDVKQHSSTIAEVVKSGYMPPWKPVHAGVEFAGDRRLKESDRQAFLSWIEDECPLGDETKIPSVPKYPSDWALGKPDLVIKMSEPFQVPASGRDIYRSFVFPIDLPEDKWIKAIELRPTARGAVHHALFFVDDAQAGARPRERDGQPGFSGMNFLGGNLGGNARGNLGSFGDQAPDRLNSGLGGYVPGATPNRLPGDLARLLPAHSNIIMQTHFHPTGKVEVEQGELGLYFTDVVPEHRLLGIQLPAIFGVGAGLKVPAGTSDFQLTDSYTLPTAVKAWEVGGHAHYICREMELTASLPSGQRITLLKIDDWDLDWQDQYGFKEPIELPRGTKLDARILYDNSSDNPENPFSPPKEIAWGRESTDEMGSITLLVTAVDENDRSKLTSDMRDRARQAIRNRIAERSGASKLLEGQGGRLRELRKRLGGKSE